MQRTQVVVFKRGPNHSFKPVSFYSLSKNTTNTKPNPKLLLWRVVHQKRSRPKNMRFFQQRADFFCRKRAYQSLTVNFLRPFFLLLLRTFLPAEELILFLNPCLFTLLRLLILIVVFIATHFPYLL